MSITVVVPSRGRPHNAEAIGQAFTDTDPAAGLLVCLDADDPTQNDYPEGVATHVGQTHSMAEALNQAAVRLAAGAYPGEIIGFMGDDHRPRTDGWAARIAEAMAALGGTGIVYGNDLVHGAGLPTAVFVSADIVRALGYMAPPCLRHMYLDNYWKALGEGAECLRYLPDVVIEHVHPLVGKAPDDDGYRRVAQLMGPDGDAYRAFVDEGWLAADVAKVRRLREGHPITGRRGPEVIVP